jgi:hypothetical protein
MTLYHVLLHYSYVTNDIHRIHQTSFGYLFNFYLGFFYMGLFIIFTLLFIFRIRNTWKYFIFVLGIAILQLVTDEIIDLISDPVDYILFIFLFLRIFAAIIYLIIIYYTYQNRNYFKRPLWKK